MVSSLHWPICSSIIDGLWRTDNQGSSDSDKDQPTFEHVEFAENQDTALNQIPTEFGSSDEDKPTFEHIEFAEDQGTSEKEEVVEDHPTFE